MLIEWTFYRSDIFLFKFLSNNQAFFTDIKHPYQLSSKYTNPSTRNININYKKLTLIEPTQSSDIIDRTKTKGKIKNMEKLKSQKKNLTRKYLNSSIIRNSNIQIGNDTRHDQNVQVSKSQLYKPEPLHRIRRQVSPQNVFHNLSKNDFFQSSAAIKVLTPLNGDSGMFLPGMDYEFVTEMSDKEFESLGFPVSPKPTESYRLSGNDHDYGLIGSLGDHYDTDTGGFSGIEIISRELFLASRDSIDTTSSNFMAN